MIATGALAFANARVRALKSRLLGREIGGRFAAGLAATRDQPLDAARSFQELLDCYSVIFASYPRGLALVEAMLRRLELENIKLVWRAVMNRSDAGRWIPQWLAFDRLATARLDDFRDCRTLPSLVEGLTGTPFAAIGGAMWRAHAHDALAAEIGFDRWASRAIVDAAAALPADDRTATALAIAMVRERDFNVMRRAAAAGLSPEALTGALGYVHLELDAGELMRLAAWSPATGPFWAAVPRQWQRRAHPVADWDQWLLWWRRRRRELCRRAFLESPFCVAPAIALLLLKEEEVRGLEAIAAFEDIAGAAGSLEYALAPGALGA